MEGGLIISVVFSKLNTPTLKETCTQALLSRILSGELKTGEKLPSERELAEMLGISRSIVNQSLLELESRGFVEIQPRRGTIVCDYRKHPTPQSLAALMTYGSVKLDHPIFSDMMAFRLLIETECARLACFNIYAATLSEMTADIDALEKGADPEECIYSFHYRLTQASGNSVYSMLFRGFEPALRALIAQHYHVRTEDIKESVHLHRSLLTAIESKEEQRAIQLVREILTQGISVLEESYH